MIKHKLTNRQDSMIKRGRINKEREREGEKGLNLEEENIWVVGHTFLGHEWIPIVSTKCV